MLLLPVSLALLALSPGDTAEHLLVVLNKSDATASLLDAETGKTIATLPTGAGPHEVAVHGDRAYAASGPRRRLRLPRAVRGW